MAPVYLHTQENRIINHVSPILQVKQAGSTHNNSFSSLQAIVARVINNECKIQFVYIETEDQNYHICTTTAYKADTYRCLDGRLNRLEVGGKLNNCHAVKRIGTSDLLQKRTEKEIISLFVEGARFRSGHWCCNLPLRTVLQRTD